MAEPRFNNPYFWPPPPTMPGQMDNIVLINKIKEQLMAEKIRPPHLPPSTVPSPQQRLGNPTQTGGGQQVQMSVQKLQQMQQGLHVHSSSQPDIALHTRTASSSVAGLALSSRTGNHNTSITLTTPTSNSQSRLGGALSPHHVLSSLASGPGMEQIKSNGGLAGLLGRGRKKIKAENSGGPLLVVPYPILASGNDQSCHTIIPKEGKCYRCKLCPLTFFSKSDMQMHSKSHTEVKPHKCPYCSKSFTNASYLAQHLRIHLGVKPYHCSYCEKCFRQLSHLQQHTRIHTGDRPYKCAHPGCEKAFTQLSNLQSHQRQHNKDKPYKCPNCYRAYSDSASLQIHLSVHAIKNAKAYCCSMCGRAYTSETYLMKHMSKHTVVEHLVSHHSPQRTGSPNIPIRISLI
ncbi:zinc finger protein 362 isoform X2 [Oncorhynchus kisutch]|uniref:Zinc finger protein 362a n=1 Tax=Oncorhynchus kisutch TaxID=8019 RepID=A0A8C7CJK9_ONCKI|nr:zinc finger protein 362 isoform X2 [Oncorhynchus kisutch]